MSSAGNKVKKKKQLTKSKLVNQTNAVGADQTKGPKKKIALVTYSDLIHDQLEPIIAAMVRQRGWRPW